MKPRTLLSSNQAQTLDLSSACQTSEAGIVSRTLLQTAELRVVLFAFAEGQELTGHSSQRRVVVQILSGECEFQFNETWTRLSAGTLLHLPPGHPHAVRASSGPMTFMLTFGTEPLRT